MDKIITLDAPQDQELSPEPLLVSLKVIRMAGGSVAVRAVTDTTAVTAVSAETNEAGTEITVTCSEALMADVIAAAGAWTITGDDATVASSAVDGSTIVLTLTGTIENGDEITLDYTEPATNGYRDLYGNALATFTALECTNNVPGA
jgi:hypothetical protein